MLAGCLEGGVPVNYDVLVNREDVPQHVLYQSRPGLVPDAFVDWVNLMPVFGIHSRDLDPVTAQGLMPDAAAHRWRLFIKPRGRFARGGGGGGAAAQPVDWRRRADAAGAQRRAAGAVGAPGAARRAQQSLELVARISHELRTPLSTITCAGENLADSVVANAEDTRHYGRIIQQEGRRLHKTIADILLCCRLQTRADAVLNLQPTRSPR